MPQLTIQESLDRKKLWPRNHPEQVIAEEKLVFWLVDDTLPYEVTGNVHFAAFLRCFTQRFVIPSPKVVRTRLIPDLDRKIQWNIFNAIAEHLKNGGVPSITTDLWTSPSKDSLMSLTIHLVNADFRRKMVVFRCIRYDTAHTDKKFPKL